MLVLPAIDLRDGKVVRLQRGDYDRQTTYGDDPAAVAKQFVQAGAQWIHMVDLDAARTGRFANLAALRSVLTSTGARVEFGGGARTTENVELLLAEGVSRVVIGSAALKNWAWFEQLASRIDLAGKLALGLDARNGKVAAAGWTEQTDTTAIELARRVKGWPLGAIVYTDISRDGMLEGVNIAATAEMVTVTDVPVIASGGVSSIEDVHECLRIGCAGVIIGRAWYDGRVDLAEACRAATKR